MKTHVLNKIISEKEVYISKLGACQDTPKLRTTIKDIEDDILVLKSIKKDYLK